MRVDPSIYKVRMFSERGYIRQKCKVCGENFWAVIERDNCGDAPCSDYTFFDMKIRSGPLTVKEARDKFLNFFKRKGHEVLDPYPVVARWRDDLYLTIASIIVFQPHVTSGIVPPPANPLVIAQPCIRLEDLDSVGYTFGRHLTSFIMGGHHAFNYPDKKVYFTHTTVELAREFFTSEIGVPEEELVFKESWWEGGGNAGPSFEVAAGGLELATLVFMMYEEQDGKYKEMPIKIVDTGYGIERIAWFTQKTPTSFHAIYGRVVSDYHRILGVEEPPEDLLRTVIKYVGRLNPKDAVLYSKLKSLVSQETGFSVEDVGKLLDGAIMIYALLDHVKTASLMLADGVVPSNSGEGYLARLVLRRIFRILTLLRSLESVHELFRTQAKYWTDLYPQINEKLGYIEDVVTHELKKYTEIINRAPQLIRRYVKKGGEGLSEEELIELYDSHGIPPEVVSEIANKLGLKVTVPPDFYSRVASRHSKAPIKEKQKIKLPDEVVSALKDVAPTEALFHKDPYIREFKARIKKVLGQYFLLDRTAFYPEGGGQAPDTGYVTILPENESVRVIDVQKVGDIVVHKADKALDPGYEGREVIGIIDWERRYVLMRHHTATHIILGVARQVLGDHVWQAGAEKTPKRARLDITHYKPLTKEEIRKIEDLANKVILEGRPVKTAFMPKYEAEKKYGFRLYEGGVILQPVIRVVEIEGLDAEACFGTHLKNTMEAGAIKIVNTDRIADGVVRLEYVAGTQVAEYARELEERIEEASKELGGDIVQKAKAVIKELRDVRARINEYRRLYASLLRESLLREFTPLGKYELCVTSVPITDKEVIKELLISISQEKPNAIIALLIPRGKGTQIEISLGTEAKKSIHAGKLLKEVLTKLQGSGGGKPDHASGFIRKELTGELKQKILTEITEIISKQT